jgi:hypothetical protein
MMFYPQSSDCRCIPWLLALFIAACSAAPYRHEPLADFDLQQRAVVEQRGGFRVSTSVPSRDEAQKIFGVPLYQQGIQPVWLEISNNSDVRARLILSSLDPDYFPPFEVAYLYRKHFSGQGRKDLEAYLHGSAMPRQIAPQETVSGFVFTHAATGTKAFNVEIFHATEDSDYEQFTFFVEVPGFVPDHAEVDFDKLWPADQVIEAEPAELGVRIQDLPRCTSNHDGSEQGRPANVYLVAQGRDVLRALLRAGWSETSYQRDRRYLAEADYLFGRPPDAVFRKGRDKASERIELGLWLAPLRVAGKPLWVGQLKNAIGRRYAVGEQFLSIKLDPDVNDGRDFLLQDLWYAQSLQHWGWLESGLSASEETPALDFNGNPWFVDDGYSVAIWVSGQPVALQDATEYRWPAVPGKRDPRP